MRSPHAIPLSPVLRYLNDEWIKRGARSFGRALTGGGKLPNKSMIPSKISGITTYALTVARLSQIPFPVSIASSSNSKEEIGREQ